MKSTILADGTLSIAPETELEAYALDQWCRVNIDYRRATVHMPKICIDFSGYPGAMLAMVPSSAGESRP
ncbi:hypothetical protein [Paraburkholderia xenovorans]